MAKTQLEVIAEQLRTQEIVINRYSDKNGYGLTSKDAISDGEYGKEFGYGLTNPNAISDGDELGKGQKGDDGQIGSLTDINTRTLVINKNKFGEHNKYPDFE